jgi:hypothetical protein
MTLRLDTPTPTFHPFELDADHEVIVRVKHGDAAAYDEREPFAPWLDQLVAEDSLNVRSRGQRSRHLLLIQ